MPFYYAINPGNVTSNGTGNTETDHLRLLTVANQREAQIVGLLGCNQGATTGGLRLRFASFTTPSTVGSSATPAKRDPGAPAASTTAFTGPTIGSTRTTHFTVGLPQTGGLGQWAALEPAHAVTITANGGASGNADVISIATTASQTFDYTLEFSE